MNQLDAYEESQQRVLSSLQQEYRKQTEAQQEQLETMESPDYHAIEEQRKIRREAKKHI